jgi:hypothetical protein
MITGQVLRPDGGSAAMRTADSSGCMFILGRGKKSPDFLGEKIYHPPSARDKTSSLRA